MDQDVGSRESSHLQPVTTTSISCCPVESAPVYFLNEDESAQTISPANHDLVREALELASVSPYKINRESRHIIIKNPSVQYGNSLAESNEDHLNGASSQNIDGQHYSVQHGNDKPKESHCTLHIEHEPKADTGVCVPAASSTPNYVHVYSGGSSISTDFMSSALNDSLANSISHGQVFIERTISSESLFNLPVIQRFVPVKEKTDQELSLMIEKKPISFFRRLTGKSSSVLPETSDTISDPTEESLVSLIDSVNEYSESQMACMSNLAGSQTPVKHRQFEDLTSKLISPKSTPGTPACKRNTGISGLMTIECRICHKRVSNLSLRMHMKTHSIEKQHTSLKKTSNDQLFDTKSTTLKCLYDVKKKVSWQSKRYICSVCRKRFTRSSYLKVHKRIHTGETPFSCSLCDKKFKYKRSFNEHVADHKQIKLYHCDICNKKYNRQSAFDYHRRNHKRKDAKTKTVLIAAGEKSETVLRPTEDLKLNTDSAIAVEVSAALSSKILYSKKGRSFTCSICNKHFAKEHLIKNHIVSHELDFNQCFTCSVCDKKLQSITLLKSHIVQHALDIYSKSLVSIPDRGTRPVTRSVSGQSSDKVIKSAAKLHVSINTPNPKSEEHRTFRSDREKTVPEQVAPKIGNIKNKKSNPTINLVPIVKELEASKDNELEIDYAVDDCNTTIMDEANVWSNEVSNCQDDGDENIIFCRECGKVVKSEELLNVHMKTHSSSKYVCNRCGRYFKTQHNFQKHMTWHETKQVVKSKRGVKANCEICAKSVRVDCMKSHIRTHTGERPFQCDYCGTTFKQATHLKTHITIHTGEKPHQCVYCGQVFRKTGNLIVHMRNHTGEKPYKCDVCSESFKHLAIYKEHLASHSGITLYQCEFCGHKYKSRSGYDSHKRRNHKKDSIFKCYSCGVIYKTSKEVINCACLNDASSPNKSITSAPPENTNVETVVTNFSTHSTQSQSIMHTDVPISSVYSSMMGILNHPASNEIIPQTFQQ